MVDTVIFDFDDTILDTSNLNELRKSRKWRQIKSSVHLVEEYDGMKKLFDYLQSKKFKIGIVTNSPSTYCQHLMSEFSFPFDALVGYHDTVKKKPHPQPIYKVLEKLVSEPHKSVGIGDNINDLNAYRSANIKSFHAGWSSNINIGGHSTSLKHPIDLIKFIS